MLWSVAASLKNMVAKRLTSKSASSQDKQDNAAVQMSARMRDQERFAARFDEEVMQDKALAAGSDGVRIGGDGLGQARQFDSFHDQLK